MKRFLLITLCLYTMVTHAGDQKKQNSQKALETLTNAGSSTTQTPMAIEERLAALSPNDIDQRIKDGEQIIFNNIVNRLNDLDTNCIIDQPELFEELTQETILLIKSLNRTKPPLYTIDQMITETTQPSYLLHEILRQYHHNVTYLEQEDTSDNDSIEIMIHEAYTTIISQVIKQTNDSAYSEDFRHLNALDHAIIGYKKQNSAYFDLLIKKWGGHIRSHNSLIKNKLINQLKFMLIPLINNIHCRAMCSLPDPKQRVLIENIIKQPYISTPAIASILQILKQLKFPQFPYFNDINHSLTYHPLYQLLNTYLENQKEHMYRHKHINSCTTFCSFNVLLNEIETHLIFHKAFYQIINKTIQSSELNNTPMTFTPIYKAACIYNDTIFDYILENSSDESLHYLLEPSIFFAFLEQSTDRAFLKIFQRLEAINKQALIDTLNVQTTPNPLHALPTFCTTLESAIATNSCIKIKKILELTPSLVTFNISSKLSGPIKFNWCPALTRALKTNRLEIIHLVLQAIPQKNLNELYNSIDTDNNCPFSIALLNKNKHYATMLLEHTSDETLTKCIESKQGAKTNELISLIHLPDNYDLLKKIIHRIPCSIDVTDEDNYNALHHAMDLHDVKAFQLLFLHAKKDSIIRLESLTILLEILDKYDQNTEPTSPTTRLNTSAIISNAKMMLLFVLPYFDHTSLPEEILTHPEVMHAQFTLLDKINIFELQDNLIEPGVDYENILIELDFDKYFHAFLTLAFGKVLADNNLITILDQYQTTVSNYDIQNTYSEEFLTITFQFANKCDVYGKKVLSLIRAAQEERKLNDPAYLNNPPYSFTKFAIEKQKASMQEFSNHIKKRKNDDYIQTINALSLNQMNNLPTSSAKQSPTYDQMDISDDLNKNDDDDDDIIAKTLKDILKKTK